MLIILLAWISTGCYVPISRPGAGSRTFFPASPDEFTIGETSRIEILFKMGEPDRLSKDEKELAYVWVEEKGVFTLTGCDAHPIVEKTTAVFRFDEKGILESLDVFYDE